MATELPKFKVTQPPGFFDGERMHPPGAVLVWDAVTQRGAENKPSATFLPLNKEAATLLTATKVAPHALLEWERRERREAEQKVADARAAEERAKAELDRARAIIKEAEAEEKAVEKPSVKK